MELITVVLLLMILATLFIGKWLGTDGFNDQDRADLYATTQRTRIIMAQIDDLLVGLNALGDDVDKLEQELQTAVAAAANNQPTDLTAALNIVSSLRSKLETTTNTASSAADAGSGAGADTGTSSPSSDTGTSSPSSDTGTSDTNSQPQ